MLHAGCPPPPVPSSPLLSLIYLEYRNLGPIPLFQLPVTVVPLLIVATAVPAVGSSAYAISTAWRGTILFAGATAISTATSVT